MFIKHYTSVQSLVKCLFKSLFFHFYWVVCLLLRYESSLYILYRLSDMIFNNFFYKSVALFLFEKQKFLILMKSNLSVFKKKIMEPNFGAIAKKSLPKSGSIIFSLRSFIVLFCHLHLF